MRCVIIGAGPSGLAAGIKILKESQEKAVCCECIIIEKDIHQNKPCGGLITPKAKDLLLHLEISTSFLHCCNEIEVEYKNMGFAYHTTESFYTCHRSDLIFRLTQKYKSLGGKIIWNKVISVEPQFKRIKTEADIFYYDFLVLASGYRFNWDTSIDDQHCSQKISIGVSSIIKPSQELKNNHSIHIWFLKELEGYCWRFPLSDNSLNIGFAGRFTRYPQNEFSKIKEEFSAYLGIGSVKYQGRFLPIDSKIPVGLLMQKELTARIYRVGEAGGYFDSLTGEGVYFALLTGILAARHITGMMTTSEYLQAQKIVTKLCKGSSFTRNLLYKKWLLLPALLHIAQLTKALDAYMTENLILRYKYDYYTAYLSPFFCYTNQGSPFKTQEMLDMLIDEKGEQ